MRIYSKDAVMDGRIYFGTIRRIGSGFDFSEALEGFEEVYPNFVNLA